MPFKTTTIKPRLLQQHLDDLRKSGLNDETVAACQFCSIEGAEVARVLGWKSNTSALGPCLLIPFLDREGKPTDFARLKPDTPRATKNGKGQLKPCKYEQPKGRPV